MKKDILKTLYKIGLTEKQAEVYGYLLKNGSATPAVISEHVSITRPSIYRILLELSIKGLVDEIKEGKKKKFYISSVDKLSAWKKDNIRYVQRQSELLESSLPDFKNILLSSENTIHVQYFNDIDALHKIYDDHLAYDNYEMIGFSDISNVSQFIGASYVKKYIQSKKTKNIRTRGIIPKTEFGESYQKDFYGKNAYDEQVQINLIDPQKFPIGVGSEITLYGDNKISLVDVSQKPLSGIIIQNESLYQTFKSIFEIAWISL